MRRKKGLKTYRSTFGRNSATKKKKPSKNKELEVQYGVKPTYYRYDGLKGIYWSLLSEYIRRRDFYKWGTCISCGKTFNTWKDSQAGHYAPAGNCGFALLFDETNINGECPRCNNPRISPGKLIGYRANLVARYGERYVKKVDERYRAALANTTKEWTAPEYDKEIRKLQRKIVKLIKENEGVEEKLETIETEINDDEQT